VAEEGKVSAESYRNLYAECRALEVILAEKEDELETLRRRNEGMLNHLTRIRTKADLASGFIQGGMEDCSLQGRSSGAEGAVDRLIAMFAGKLCKERKEMQDATE
jgi:hypothetical protein